MVFSFFKKKDKQPEERMPERPSVRPKPLNAPDVPEARVVPESSPAPLRELPELEFSVADLQATSVPVPVPAPAPVAPAPLECAPAALAASPPIDEPTAAEKELTISEFDRNFTESAVMAIDVEHGMDPLQAEIEQVAVLFANGQDAAARSLLDVFVRAYEGEEARRFWAMYFDLLQLQDDQVAFEALGLEFAASCESSPPAWEANRFAHAAPKLEQANLTLQGVLTAENSQLLKPFLLAVESQIPVNLNCAQLLACDDAIAGQLAAILQRAAVLGVPVIFESAERLLASLRTRMVSGVRENASSWQLAFELLQGQGAQAEFEEKALDFAVTFEQSPPSWVVLAPVSLPQLASPLAEDAYYLSGDIRSCKFEALNAVLEKHAVPVLDFSGVQRMDFFSAGQLVSRLGIFKHSGGDVIIRNPNHLVAELLGVVGIHQYARLLMPKF